MNRHWVYGSGALALLLAGAGLAIYLADSAEDPDPQIVDLSIPPRDDGDEKIRRIPLDPALEEVAEDPAEPDTPVASAEDEFPILPGTEIESQEPAVEPLPAQLIAAIGKRGLQVDEGVRFGRRWVVFGELFSDHAWVEIVDERGVALWRRRFEESRIRYWQVLSNELDLTLDGKADLHLISWTGGAHCCTAHHLFDAKRPDSPQVLDQGHGEPQQFRKVDAGAPVIWLPQSAAYLWTSFAGSAVFWIPIRYDGREFRPATALMTRPAETSQAQVRELMLLMLDAHQAGERVQTDPLALLLQAVGDEIYAGRTESAQTLIADVWPKGLPGEADFRCMAVDWFEAGEYVDVLESLNGKTIRQLLQRPKTCPSEEGNRWG